MDSENFHDDSLQRSDTIFKSPSVQQLLRISWSSHLSHVNIISEVVLRVSKQRRPRDVPLVWCKEEDVSTGRVHLVWLPGVNGLLLHSLNLKSIQLLVKHLKTKTQNLFTLWKEWVVVAVGHHCKHLTLKLPFFNSRLCCGKIQSTHKIKPTWQRSITMLSWIFCHKWALKIWMREIFSVGILPCMKIPVRSSCTWKPTYT